MDSEDVEILGVDYGADCLCLSRNRDKKLSVLTDGQFDASGNRRSVSSEDCFIIDDSSTRPHDKPSFIDLDSFNFDRPFQSHVDVEEHSEPVDSSLTVPASKRHQMVAPAKNVSSFSLNSNSEQHPQSSIKLGSATQECYNRRDSPRELEVGLVERDGPNSFGAPTGSPVGATSAECSDHLLENEKPPSSLDFPAIAPIVQSGLVADIQRTPKCWTVCPNCPADVQRKFHLIDVAQNSAEWTFVSSQLQNSNFIVNRIQRIQNETLWQRLCYEKQLMLKDKKSINEQLLYHTSRTTVEIIAEEGLDIRLSTSGNFGSGIYFSDNPQKCNGYWRGISPQRYMFCCRVLLGDIKVYPKGKAERLRREPRKEHWVPGDPSKYYDSVMGNLSGQNEFVVYNMYRVMPEYVLHYELPSTELWPEQSSYFLPMPPVLPDPHSSMMFQKMMTPKPKKRKRKRH